MFINRLMNFQNDYWLFNGFGYFIVDVVVVMLILASGRIPLTEKSGILKEHHLRQYAGWSPGSNMHLKYLHYFGNEPSERLLEAYGIVTKDKHLSWVLRPKQCPNCSEPNKPDSRFCAKCRMVLTYDAYNETLESEKQ